MRALLVAAALLYISAEAAADSRPIPLVCFEDPALADHKGVAVALRALGRRAATAVPQCPVNHDAAGATAAATLPAERVVRVGLDPALPSQHYELHTDRLNGGDLNGLIYGLLDLPKLWHWQVSASAPARQAGRPAFTSRVYSIEGQYLDLPDVAYYSKTPPYLNTSLIAAEAAAIARGLPTLVRNSEICQYHPRAMPSVLCSNPVNLLQVACVACRGDGAGATSSECRGLCRLPAPGERQRSLASWGPTSTAQRCSLPAGRQAGPGDPGTRSEVLLQAVRIGLPKAVAEALPPWLDDPGENKQHPSGAQGEIQRAVRADRR
jgi:hypothetical protein